MFLRTQRTPSGTYLLLVENAREGPRVRQRILHRFGRLDELRASGQLDSLLTSLGRFAESGGEGGSRWPIIGLRLTPTPR